MDYKHGILDTVGNTPLIRLENIEKLFDLNCHIFAKLERCNPTGSIKDRAAKAMILDALEKKRINKETTIVEPTSGNTGISLCAIASALNLKTIIFMPANMSKERINMMKAFGAEIVLTDTSLGMQGAIDACINYQKNHPNTFMPSQFENEANSDAHYLSTGREIYHQLDGNVDIFVAAFGTGGTLSGTAKYLKEQNPKIKVVGLEPSSSPLITKGKTGPHKIQGIGANFIPPILKREYIDQFFTIDDEEAYKFCLLLARKEGLFCGVSSGANLAGCIKVAKENPNCNIVTVLPDDGERYLSVDNLFDRS